jgi:predicted O-methyltransferase YrrM
MLFGPMPILERLVGLYSAQGIEVCVGLPSHHFNGLPTANFTWFLKDGQKLTDGLGIASQEIYLLETLFAAYRPHRVMVIGNSLGWSTLALALLLPEAKVVAIDAGLAMNSLMGLDLTNRIATEERLAAKALKAISPEDVAKIIDTELGGSLDFAFIDGLHENKQIVLDFTALRSKAAADAVYLFHDVHEFELYAGLAEIERLSGWAAQQLTATTSGMALICDWARHPEVEAAVAPFAPSPSAVAVIREEAASWQKLQQRSFFYHWRGRLSRLRSVVNSYWALNRTSDSASATEGHPREEKDSWT